MHALRVVWIHIKLSVLNELQYQGYFWTQLAETVISAVSTLGAIAVIYSHTTELAGWRQADLNALLGIWFLMRSFVHTMVQPSLELFMRDVRQGTFDYVLLKPVDSQLLVSCRSIEVWSLIDGLLGVAILSLSLGRMNQTLGIDRLLAFFFTFGCGTVIVYCFWLILATCCFWFVRIQNILVIFDSMYEAGRWPVSIYPRVLRMTLTFLVPVAFAVTVPAEALTGFLTLRAALGSFSLAILFLIVSRRFWKNGLENYSGASA